MHKISFVMPTKNRGKIIGSSIQSIIDQDISEWELVVVDDHSDEDDITESIIKSFKDDRIRYIKIPDNFSGGIPCARNFGNMVASSPIIAVSDSDDRSLSTRARITVEAFSAAAIDAFYGAYFEVNELTGEKKDRSDLVLPFDYEELLKRNYIPHGSVAYRREIAYEFPYNSFFRVAEDYELLTRLAKAQKRFYYCELPVYEYLIHDGSISSGKKICNYEDLIHQIRKSTAGKTAGALSDILDHEHQRSC